MGGVKGKFDLEEVKRLITLYWKGNSSTLWFSARSRSIDSVIKVLLCNETEAEKTILDGLMKLKNTDFCRSKMQWDTIVDEYGLEDYHDLNWYIKFSICHDDGQNTLEQISFHPLEKEMRLIDERNLKVTSKNRE